MEYLNVVPGEVQQQTGQVHHLDRFFDIFQDYLSEFVNERLCTTCGLVVEEGMLLQYWIEILLPVAEGSDPTKEGEGIDVADVFQSQEVFYLFFDYFEQAGEERALLLKYC